MCKELYIFDNPTNTTDYNELNKIIEKETGYIGWFEEQEQLDELIRTGWVEIHEDKHQFIIYADTID